MNEGVGGNIIWSLVAQSDFVTKMVMSILFFMSIVCWAVSLYKLILLRIKKSQCDLVFEKMKQATSLGQVLTIAQEHKKTLPGYVLIQLLTYAKQAKEHHTTELFALQADGILDDVMYHEEAYTPVLTISASIATLLGLFGTVWGLIHAFVRISEQQSADIVAIAPGISEALITTVAGLFVAIPALIFSQYIMVRMKDIEYALMTMTDKVSMLVKISMIRPAQKESTDSIENVNIGDQISL
jgi:biopolymer transport protein TolQ